MKQFEFLTENTLKKLKIYDSLLKKWQKAINLVSSSSLTDSWVRHFMDSTQLWPLIPLGAKTLVDFGSGAGFPGLVLGIIAAEHQPALTVHLIESDTRKCAFLQEVVRECGGKIIIHPTRIEAVDPFAADVITARALKDLNTLLLYSKPFVTASTVALFLKGEKAQEELDSAQKTIQMNVQKIPSQTDEKGVVLRLTQIQFNKEIIKQGEK